MLSTGQCREILGPQFEADDESLERLRSHLYCIAEGIVDLGLRSATESSSSEFPPRFDSTDNSSVIISNFESALNCLADDQREEIVERSAIMEYDGNMSRSEAEKCAFRQTRKGIG